MSHIMYSLLASIHHCFCLQDGWILAQGGVFQAMISIHGSNDQHVCSGVLISNRYILTAANCIDVVGPNPVVVIGAHRIGNDRCTEGAQVIYDSFFLL